MAGPARRTTIQDLPSDLLHRVLAAVPFDATDSESYFAPAGHT